MAAHALLVLRLFWRQRFCSFRRGCFWGSAFHNRNNVHGGRPVAEGAIAVGSTGLLWQLGVTARAFEVLQLALFVTTPAGMGGISLVHGGKRGGCFFGCVLLGNFLTGDVTGATGLHALMVADAA